MERTCLIRKILGIIAVLVPVIAPAQSAPVMNEATLMNLLITGHTNVNSFSLFLDQPPSDRPSRFIAGSTELNSLNFNIPLDRLNCRNKKILHDFYEIVNARKFPEVKISLRRNDLDWYISGVRKDVKPISLIVTLAGISRRIQTNDILLEDSAGKRTMSGSVSLLLTDFSLESPPKFLGLVKLDNKVNVNFKISFTGQSNSALF